MVMGVVLVTLLAMIQYGCTLHDEVTGAMILEETLEKTRFQPEDMLKEALKNAAGEGTKRGNLRIWLGEYSLTAGESLVDVFGEAVAGNWKLEMKIPKYRPGEFLWGYEVMEETHGVIKNNES